MTAKFRYAPFLCIVVVCMMATAALPALAVDMSGRDTRFLVPGESPSGGTATAQQTNQMNQTQTYASPGQGSRDARFLLPGESPSGGAATAQQMNQMNQMNQAPTYASPGQGSRDARFLTPGETAGGMGSAGSPSGGNRRATGDAYIGGCKEWVNVRNDPSMGKSPVGRVYLGEGVSIHYWNDQCTWAYATYSGGTKAGWISGQFIKTK